MLTTCISIFSLLSASSSLSFVDPFTVCLPTEQTVMVPNIMLRIVMEPSAIANYVYGIKCFTGSEICQSTSHEIAHHDMICELNILRDST